MNSGLSIKPKFAYIVVRGIESMSDPRLAIRIYFSGMVARRSITVDQRYSEQSKWVNLISTMNACPCHEGDGTTRKDVMD